jgi:hypothetical protein
LEEQISKLTLENRHLRQQTRSGPDDQTTSIQLSTPQAETEPENRHTGPQTVSDESSPLLQDLVASVKNVVVGPFQQSRFLGQSSGISFAKMVMSAIHVDRLPLSVRPERQEVGETVSPAPVEASLPPRHVADHLAEVYCQYRTPHLPILSRSQVNTAIERAYSSSGNGQLSDDVHAKDVFVAYMVFAIALVDVPHSSTGRPGQSEGCFRSALCWVEKILTYSKSDLETLRIVLLLAQFVALSPSRGSLWHLTGFAMRLCIDVGLHWETESQCHSMAPELLDDRRRLWHSTYHLDRLLCITLGRPFGILDESTRVQLPSPWVGSRQSLGARPNDFDIHSQRAHNHLFTLARLESEIKHVQHSQVWALKIAYPRPNRAAWLQDIQPRLQEWYDTIPDPVKAHPSSIFAFKDYWEVVYHNAILLLHRPQTLASCQRTEDLFISFEASCKVIAGLKVLQREGRVEMLWKSVHHLFLAGLTIINALWNSKEIRDRTPIGKCISTLQSCASTLSAMSETFKGAAGCRDVFETLSSTTIDSLVNKNAEETCQTRLEFEEQVRELMTPFKLALGGTTASRHDDGSDGMSAMLSADNFDLSELLNTTAQWPDLGDFNFDMMEYDVTAEGVYPGFNLAV